VTVYQDRWPFTTEPGL